MKRNILAAMISGLFLNFSEEIISSHELRAPLGKRAVTNSSAPGTGPLPQLEDLLLSTPEIISLPIEERITELCTELPSVLDSDPKGYPSTDKLSDNKLSDKSRYQNQPLTKKGFLQLQSETYLQSHRPTRNYGCRELIERLNSAAESLYTKYGTILQVYDLSRENGGYIPPHKSHRQGLDADIGIYRYKDKEKRFENSYGRLKTLDQKTLQINWDLIKAIQRDKDIDYIFWNQRYIWAMRQFVRERYGADEWKEYGKVLYHEPGHTDHFHVRVSENGENRKVFARN